MSRRKAKAKTKTNPTYKHTPEQTPPLPLEAEKSKFSRDAFRIFLGLGSTGFLVLAFGYFIDYLGRDVRLEFSQVLGSGYEFVLRNDGPSDQLIQSFRPLPVNKQDVVYHITEPVVATIGPDGLPVLPGGNSPWVPAYEFKGIDGIILHAKTERKFRLPPMLSVSWAVPDAVLVDFEFVTKSQNPILRKIEESLSSIGLESNVKRASFMVIDNYWTPVPPGKFKDAIGQACSESANLAKSELCAKRRNQ